MRVKQFVIGVAFVPAFVGLVAAREVAHFKCSDGDVVCLIDAINQANTNGLRNTITLGPGVYTLTQIDNDNPGSDANGLPVITAA
jgi:hypothetical protein